MARIGVQDYVRVEEKTPMSYALEMVAAVSDAGVTTVPAKPTTAMLTAGARAGAVSVETAWRVYQAMIRSS